MELAAAKKIRLIFYYSIIIILTVNGIYTLVGFSFARFFLFYGQDMNIKKFHIPRVFFFVQNFWLKNHLETLTDLMTRSLHFYSKRNESFVKVNLDMNMILKGNIKYFFFYLLPSLWQVNEVTPKPIKA